MKLLINKKSNLNPYGTLAVWSDNNILDLIPVQSIDSRITDAINLLTEDYYNFGKLLQDNYLISKKVVNNLIDITGLISNKELKSDLELLSSTIEDLIQIFNRFETESSAKENNLLSIQNNLHSIIFTLENYNKIVKHLRVLGISTKIENARLKIDDIGFSTIAENVEHLSEVINEKALQINLKSRTLIEDVKNIITKIKCLRDEQKEESIIIIEEAKASLSSYQLSYNSSFNNASLIQDLSSRISADINNLITFIQVQDIIRQQLEHLKENLNNAGMQPLKTKLTLEDDLDSIKQLITVCHLELAQLLHSKNEITGTAESIRTYNHNINLNAHKIVEQSNSLLFSGNADMSMHNIEENLSTISEALRKSHQTNESLTAAIHSLTDTLADSNRFVYEIEDIGAEIELIALNARIKAAHIGREGAALGVLSEAIQKLSLEAKELSLLISDGLLKILKETEELSSGNEKDQEIMLQEFKAIDGSLKNSLNRIQNSDSKLGTLKTGLNVSLKEMEQKLDIMKNGLSCQSEVLEEITYSQTVLEKYVEFASAAGIVISKEDKEFLKGFSTSYTMDSERRIHKSLTDQKTENNSSAFNAEDDILGDNIELF